jgi:D-3-phosphoglycerate dehydrogenase
MNVIGYDPALSVASALKLPIDTHIAQTPQEVFSQADYITLNVPYINKPVSEGGTHHLVSRDLLMSMKRGTHILNFARGELVDSEALKQWFDSGATGRYVSDFPDDLLWDHSNTILIPHLGASTGEAEDAAASMAADTITRFLETGTIVNSVNFPSLELGARSDTTLRIGIVNENEKGVLASVLQVLADANLNILQQVNKSRGNIAYNVIDVEVVSDSSSSLVSFSELQERLTMVDSVISSRFLHGQAGAGFAVKQKVIAEDGSESVEYFV